MLERVRRAMIAEAIIPRVTLGRTRCQRSPPPVAGNQPRCNEKAKIIRRPSQKLGIDTPRSATIIEPASNQELLKSAAVSPSGTPIATATAMLARASCAVLPTFSPISVATARRLRIEVPRSPRSALPTKRPYCLMMGSSRCSCSRIRATCSGVVTNSASMILTGSPGTRKSMLKTARVTPNSTGTTASRRRARYVSTPGRRSRASPSEGASTAPSEPPPGLRGPSPRSNRAHSDAPLLTDRDVAQHRVGVEVVLRPLHVGAVRPHREVVEQRHGQRVFDRQLLDRHVDRAPLRRVELAPALLEQLVELGVLHARPVEVAADHRGVEQREEPVRVDRPEEHDGPVGRAAVVVLVPRRTRLGLELHVDTDLVERGLDELHGRLRPAAVVDRVQDDFEALAALCPDPVGARLPPRLGQERAGLRRIEGIGSRAKRGIVEHHGGERR